MYVICAYDMYYVYICMPRSAICIISINIISTSMFIIIVIIIIIIIIIISSSSSSSCSRYLQRLGRRGLGVLI